MAKKKKKIGGLAGIGAGLAGGFSSGTNSDTSNMGTKPTPAKVTTTPEKEVVKPVVKPVTTTTKTTTTPTKTPPTGSFGGMGKPPTSTVTPVGFEATKKAADQFVTDRLIEGTQIVSSGDEAIDKFKVAYKDAENEGDKVGMANAAQAADDYRASIGQAPQNTAHVQALQDQAKKQPEVELLTQEQMDAQLAERKAEWEAEQAALAEEALPTEDQVMQNQEQITTLLNEYLSDFQFNISDSRQYAQQSKEVERQIRERFAARGITNASFVESEITRATQDLAYKIEDVQYTRWSEKANKLMQVASFLKSLDQDAFNNAIKVFDTKLKGDAAKLQARQQDFKERELEMDKAFEKWQELGYADEEVSLALGVPVLTPSWKLSEMELDFEQFKKEEQVKLDNKLYEIQAEYLISIDPDNPKYKKAVQDYKNSLVTGSIKEQQLAKAQIQNRYEESQQQAQLEKSKAQTQSALQSAAAASKRIEKADIDIEAAQAKLDVYKFEKFREDEILNAADTIFSSGMSVEEASSFIFDNEQALINGNPITFRGETLEDTTFKLGTEGYIALQATVADALKQKGITYRGFEEPKEEE